MKIFNFNLACLFAVFFLASCAEKEPYIESSPSAGSISVDAKQNVLFTGNTKYSKIFSQYPIVGYSSVRENSLADVDLRMRNELEQLSTKSAGVSVRINGRPMNSVTTKSGIPDDLYGKRVTFEVEFPATKGENSTTTTEMYIPELVRITSPAIAIEAELYPYCYYDDFLLKWNQDGNNENGLVVMVEWHGATLNGVEQQTVRNIDVIPSDNGSQVLNNKIFDKIPDKAICYMVLLRGNIENIEKSNISYTLIGETHSVLPMILVRNLPEK